MSFIAPGYELDNHKLTSLMHYSSRITPGVKSWSSFNACPVNLTENWCVDYYSHYTDYKAAISD